MWTKDIYQEQLLGYLGEVEAEIEQFAHARLQQHDLIELYVDLDIVTRRLWRLIGASDVDWERFRHPLETSCDQLQQDVYRIPRAGALMLSAVKMTEHNEKWSA